MGCLCGQAEQNVRHVGIFTIESDEDSLFGIKI